MKTQIERAEPSRGAQRAALLNCPKCKSADVLKLNPNEMKYQCVPCGFNFISGLTCATSEGMQGFVPKRTTSFQQHQRRVEQLIAEGMHDGNRWKDEAFARYNELEDQELVPVIAGSELRKAFEMLEALRHALPILIGAIAFVDCKAVVAEVRAAIKQAERAK